MILQKSLILGIAFLYATLAIGQNLKKVADIVEKTQQIWAPDKRVEIFDVDYVLKGKTLTLFGQISSSKANQDLTQQLQDAGFQVENKIQLLPDASKLGEQVWGIVRNSVCNIRSEADYDAAMVTQAQMGMPVRIMQVKGWYQIQTPDRYLGWVERKAIQPLTKAELEQWNAADQLVVTALWGQVLDAPKEKAQPLSDVVGGNRMKCLGRKGKYFVVELPDGRQGYLLRTLAEEIESWRAHLDNSAEGILKTARSLNGIPYFWAGLSPKGVDCSGFVRTTLYLHDITIPRDASQMCKTGKRIEIGDYSNLESGDLLFFGSRNAQTGRERVVHVGIYMGNKRFIHSLGTVHESSFDPSSEIYDAYDTNRLLFACRVLPYINKMDDINTTDHNPFFSHKITE